MLGEHSQPSHDCFIYIGFLILIAWLPLPMGSNRPWAWSIMEIGAYLLAVFWLTAFVFNQVSITPVFRKSALVIALFVLWLMFILFQLAPMPDPIIAQISPLSANYAASYPIFPPGAHSLSVDPYATIAAFLKSLAYVLFFCLALLLVHSRRRLRQLAYVLILSALFQAVYGSLMTLSGLEYGFFIEKYVSWGLATGTYINRNHLAGYLGMCLAVGIGMLIASLDTGESYTWKQRLRKLLQLFLSPKARLRLYLVMMVIALVMTHSRMGNTAFFASIFIAGGLGLLLSRHATRSTILLLTSLIIIDIFIVGTWFGIEKVAERIEQTSLARESRDEVDEYAIAQWKDYKIIGSGAGSFYAVFPKYRQQDVPGVYDHTHNDYLELLTEGGVVGFTLLGLAVILTSGAAIIAQYRRKDPLMRGASFAAMMGISSILIHSTVDFNLQIPANAATFMLILAMAWISCHMKTGVHK